jgi:hypothetical protein
MPVYRFYPVTKTNRTAAPAQDHDFQADALALQHAVTMANGHAIEVWHGKRLVGIVARPAPPANGTAPR